MRDSVCTNLIPYLEDHLVPEERQAFVDHLEQCADCLHTLQTHRQMDELLNRAARQGATVPGDLVDRIEKRLRFTWHRRVGIRAAALAAVVMLAAGIVHWTFRTRPVPEQVVKAPVPPTPAPSEAERATVHVSSSSNLVAAAVKSRDPTVTIYWLFPSTPPAANGGSLSSNPSRKGGS